MVSFNNHATVTFVPFFAPAPSTGAPVIEEPPGSERLAAEAERPETDRVVALKVAHALAALEVPILRSLEVSVSDGHVTLRGRVRTYLERQLATVHARRTVGVKGIRNEISIAG